MLMEMAVCDCGGIFLKLIFLFYGDKNMNEKIYARDRKDISSFYFYKIFFSRFFEHFML
jgi:hypothetical protein